MVFLREMQKLFAELLGIVSQPRESLLLGIVVRIVAKDVARPARVKNTRNILRGKKVGFAILDRNSLMKQVKSTRLKNAYGGV